jgi:hypothetical protein
VNNFQVTVGYVNSFQKQLKELPETINPILIILFSILKEENKLDKLSFKMTTMENSFREEMKDTVPSLDKDATLLKDAEEGIRKRLNGKVPFLSITSRKYDVDGDGKLDEAEQTMRDMDTDNVGYLTNEKVYKIMLEQMKLQKEVFSLKRMALVFVVIMFFLSLATLATSFAAALLVKDTKISNGNLVRIDGDSVVGTKNAGMTFTVLESAGGFTRRRTQSTNGQVTISRADAVSAYDNCQGEVIELERVCNGDGSVVLKIPICPSISRSKAIVSGDVIYTYKVLLGYISITCLMGIDLCEVTFPTGVPSCYNGLKVVDLGTAGNYVILSKAGITTTLVTDITGDIAVSPIAGAAMTGFLETTTGAAFEKSQFVTGSMFAANYAVPTPNTLTVAVLDMQAAYTDAAGRPNADGARINLGAGILGGVLPGGPDAPLTTGVYTFGTDVLLKGDIHFQGGRDDVFIIQTIGSVVQSGGYKVILDATAAGTPRAENIFWQVAGLVKLEASAHMKGILLTATAVNFVTSASLEGRVLAQTACTLQGNKITEPGDSYWFDK